MAHPALPSIDLESLKDFFLTGDETLLKPYVSPAPPTPSNPDTVCEYSRTENPTNCPDELDD